MLSNTSYAKHQYWQRLCWMASSGAPTRPRLPWLPPVFSQTFKNRSEYRDFLQNTHHISSHHARDISLSQDGLRPVIYYLEHLVQDMDESQMLSRALVSFVKFKHPRTIMHPILTFVLDLLWENLVPWSPNHTI